MTTPLPWITDRLPTEADGDHDGDVIGLLPGGLTWYVIHWSEIGPYQPWLPFTPPGATPEPAVPTSQRRIVSITRTVQETGHHTIDAVADDGTAWWKVPGDVEWTQLPALPKREVE